MKSSCSNDSVRITRATVKGTLVVGIIRGPGRDRILGRGIGEGFGELWLSYCRIGAAYGCGVIYLLYGQVLAGKLLWDGALPLSERLITSCVPFF